MYIGLHRCTSVYIGVHRCTSVYIGVSMYIGVHRCIDAHRCTSVYICVHLCMSVYIGVHRCTSVYIGVHQCTSGYIGVHRCISVRAHLCIGVHRCTSVYVCVCLCTSVRVVPPFVRFQSTALSVAFSRGSPTSSVSSWARAWHVASTLAVSSGTQSTGQISSSRSLTRHNNSIEPTKSHTHHTTEIF